MGAVLDNTGSPVIGLLHKLFFSVSGSSNSNVGIFWGVALILRVGLLGGTGSSNWNVGIL